MPVMGTESGHPHAHPPRTPLSVAELLVSRPPPADSPHPPRPSAPPPPVQRAVSRSTPPAPPPLAASVPATAAPSPSPSPSPWYPVNHASSPHVSPTTTHLAPISAPTPQHRPTLPHPSAMLAHPPAAEVSPTVQDTPRPLTPTSHRQDSAIFHQQSDSSKDAQPCGASSDGNSFRSRRGPGDTRGSTTPTSMSDPTKPSSPQSLHQPIPASAMQTHGRGQPVSRSLSQTASTHAESDLRIAQQSTAAEPTVSGNTRQQRYNKSRNDHHNHVSASTATEPTESHSKTPERPVTATSIQSALASVSHVEEQQHSEQRRDESAGERCKFCHELWKRPIPTLGQYSNHSEQTPAKNTDDMARNSMNLIARLRSFGTQADAAYEQWCYKHKSGSCAPPEGSETSSSPTTHSTTERQRTVTEDPRRDSKLTEASLNNKRKSDVPHDNDRQVNPKFRKVAFKT
ncbi:hypothetical protein ACN47E_004984 [Coniothyrium glycines]